MTFSLKVCKKKLRLSTELERVNIITILFVTEMDSYLFRGYKTSFLDRASIKLTLLRRQDVTYRCKDNNYSYWSLPTSLHTPTREIYCTMNLHSGFSTLLPIAFKLTNVTLRYTHILMENWCVVRYKSWSNCRAVGLLKIKKKQGLKSRVLDMNIWSLCSYIKAIRTR